MLGKQVFVVVKLSVGKSEGASVMPALSSVPVHVVAHPKELLERKREDVQKMCIHSRILLNKKQNKKIYMCETLCVPSLQVQVFGSFSTGLYLPTR